MKLAKRLALFVAVFAAAGCTSPRLSVVTDVDSRSWERPADIILENTDTTTLRDVTIFLRSNRRFEADSLPLHLLILTPDSLRYEERLTLRPGRQQVSAALMAESEIPYRRRVIFRRAGQYRIIITPGQPIQGMEAIGINIVKSI